MLTLYLFCGAPASGKTTISKQMAEKYNAERISFDERHYMRHNEMISPILEALMDEKNVVADSVFAYVKQRKMILDAVKNIPCKKILIYMTTPLDECLRRNANRKNHLPDFVVESFYNSIEPPTLDEGWDEIWYYK